MARRRLISLGLGLAGLLAVAAIGVVIQYRNEWLEKRVQVIQPGRLVRGAWQRPTPLRRIIAREGIKTIVTLTAINSTDHKFIDQTRVVREQGIDWVIIPMRGSRATVEQMAIAADLLADPDRQPVFFHCVAGHHRTSLAHAAYLIRHEGYTAEQAWKAVSTLSWARPEALVDRNDQFLIEEFARVQATLSPAREESGFWEVGSGKHAQTASATSSGGDRPGGGAPRDLDHLESGARQLRSGPAGPNLPIGSDVDVEASTDPS
ncbi:protein-tyrosine phosphatase family protein [Paludisphaera borealis]|uniref:protein-tyrosine phosphatase family protein n=1 Tax=Paludisphaera borealis TaxID=1387353 RepID=UPI001F486F02|nr:hypothetical protein [Paludisphaera borealis]MDR3621502.1 hypothetical protein [Paludisphaera borealis]